MAKKQTKAIIAARIEALTTKGFVLNESGNYAKGSITVFKDDIEYSNEADWNKTMESVDNSNIPFIEGEHIEQKDEAEVVTAIVPTMDSEKDIKALRENPLVKAIAEFKAKYSGLTFTGLDDKTGIEAIKSAKKVVQKTRIFIKKTEDTLKAPYIKGSKDIKAVADEYRAMIEPIEEPLDKELERLDNLVNEEAKRKEEEAAKELNRRIDLLKAAGMTFDGSFYVIGDTISMDASTLKAMPLFDFEVLEQKVKKEKERLDNLEAERLKLLYEQRFDVRSGMLKTLGYEYSIDHDGIFAVPKMNMFPSVKKSTLINWEDAEFMKFFNEVSAAIAKAKEEVIAEINKKQKETMMKLRSKLLVATGLQETASLPNMAGPGFFFVNTFVQVYVTNKEVEEMDDAAFDDALGVYESQVQSGKQQQAAKEEEDNRKQQRQTERTTQLMSLGLTRAPQQLAFVFVLPDAKATCSVSYDDLAIDDEQAWNKIIESAKSAIQIVKDEQAKFESDKAKAEALFTSRQYDLLNLGMVVVGTTSFIIKNEFNDAASISVAEVKAIDEDNWPRRLSEITVEVNTVKYLTEEKRAAAAAELDKLKPEVQRAMEYINQVIAAAEKLAAYNLTNEALVDGITKFKVDVLTNCQEAQNFIDNFGIDI